MSTRIQTETTHPLKIELYERLRCDPAIFDFFQEHTLDGIWLWDLTNPERRWVNSKFWELLGYDASEKGDVAWQNVIHPDDYKQSLKLLEKHCADPSVPYDLEVRYLHQDGSTVWVRSRGLLLRDETGKPVRMLGILRDLTPLKLSESELDRFFHLAQDILCISSADGYFKRISHSVTDVLGWTVDEFLHTPYLELVHPDDLEKTVAEVDRQVRLGQKVLNFENRYRHKNGGWRVLAWKSVPQPGGLMYATARDITDQKLAEEELHRQNEQVAEANKELEAFSYSVSHDLRTPLRGISGFSQILQEDYGHLLDPEGHRLLDVVMSEAKRMGRLIDDLLAFSRLGRQEMLQVKVNMTSLAKEALVNMNLPPENHSEVLIGQLELTYGDPNLLRQVFVNLIGNAVKFSSKAEHPRIEVSSAIEGAYAVYQVKDNGVGFDQRHADKLFGVFQRLHAAHEFEGTGVGLALVQRIIHRHGGTIHAESTLGQGACFSFRLPLAKKKNGRSNR